MLTESGNTRSEQLFVMPTEQLTNWERLKIALGMFKGPAEFLDKKISDLFEYTHIMEKMPVRGLYT